MPHHRHMSSPTAEQLWEAACKVRHHAYAPYSNYKVGAALLIQGSDQMFTGCNVENASYGATICAERSAVFQAVAHSSTSPIISELVLVTESPVPPCGMCLQVLSEFCTPETQLYLSTPDSLLNSQPFSAYVPRPFSPDSL